MRKVIQKISDFIKMRKVIQNSFLKNNKISFFIQKSSYFIKIRKVIQN
jgi:hypothetical protein